MRDIRSFSGVGHAAVPPQVGSKLFVALQELSDFMVVLANNPIY